MILLVLSLPSSQRGELLVIRRQLDFHGNDLLILLIPCLLYLLDRQHGIIDLLLHFLATTE